MAIGAPRRDDAAVQVFATVVFVCVYAGLAAGRVPGLRLDRSGIALFGAIALLAAGALDMERAWAAIDAGTLALLFGLMVVSAQLHQSGFYGAVTQRLATARVGPRGLLALLVIVAGGLSAVLQNDIVCLAMPPLLLDVCTRRRLDPIPFLLALAAAANVGSAATLIGNPQNVLVGQRLGLSFGGYLLFALPSVAVGLVACWALACWRWRGRFELASDRVPDLPPRFDRGQGGKGLGVRGALVLVLLFSPMPRDAAALAAAGLLLLSRSMSSRALIAAVDGQLLLLFSGLFVVHAAFETTGLPERALAQLAEHGIRLGDTPWFFGATLLLSNLVSNVPAVMLLLPVADGATDGYLLALVSTFAGNLLLVGSIANLIVVAEAERLGVSPVGRSWFLEHVRYGLPVTVVTMLAAAASCAVIAP